MSNEHHNCEQLFSDNTICPLNCVEDLTYKWYRPLFPLLDLTEDCTNDGIRCVGVQDECIPSSGAHHHFCCDCDLLKLCEQLAHLLVSILPFDLSAHTGVAWSWPSLGWIPNVNHKPQELLYLLHPCWFWPLHKCTDMTISDVHLSTLYPLIQKRCLTLEIMHFLGLSFNQYCQKHEKTTCRFGKSSFHDDIKIIQINDDTQPDNTYSTKLMIHWNITGALDRPNGIQRNEIGCTSWGMPFSPCLLLPLATAYSLNLYATYRTTSCLTGCQYTPWWAIMGVHHVHGLCWDHVSQLNQPFSYQSGLLLSQSLLMLLI